MANFAVSAGEEVIKRGKDLIKAMALEGENQGDTLNRIFDIVEQSRQTASLQRQGIDTKALEASLNNIRNMFEAAVSGRIEVEEDGNRRVRELEDKYKKLIEDERRKNEELLEVKHKQNESLLKQVLDKEKEVEKITAELHTAKLELENLKLHARLADELIKEVDRLRAEIEELKE